MPNDDPTPRPLPSGGVAQPGQVGVNQPSPDEQKAAAAAQVEAARIRDEEAAALAEARRLEAERDEAANAQPLAVDDEPAPTKVGDGGVKLSYLGTSDEFDFGPASDDDQRHVIAKAGGEPVDVPAELADSVKNLPHDKFQESK